MPKRIVVEKHPPTYKAYQYEGGGKVPEVVQNLVDSIKWPIEFRKIPGDGIYWFDCHSNFRIYPGDWIIVTDCGFEAITTEGLEHQYRDATEPEIAYWDNMET